MAKNKTHEEFIYELSIKNPNIEVMNKYINSKTKMKCKCIICGCEWETVATALIKTNSTGCPICKRRNTAKKRSKTNDDFIKELNKINKNIIPLDIYENAHKRIKFKCLKCNHEWTTSPNNVLYNKTGCPKCYGNITKTHEEFIEEMSIINKDIIILTKYVDSHTKVDYKCNICNCHWSATPTNLLQGKGCPKCYISNGEKRIMKYLDNNNISYIYDEPYLNDLLGLGGKNLRPDFIIEDIKVWIEFDGEFHYNDFYKDGSYETLKYHDKLKDEYAKEHGWKLIRIPYWEYNNIENILNEILNKSDEVK